MVAMDLLVHPKHLIYIRVLYINTIQAEIPHAACTPVDWKFMAVACRGSAIKPGAAGKLDVHTLRPAAVQ